MKIRLWYSTTAYGSEVEEIVEASDYDFTDEELMEMHEDTRKDLEKLAKEFMWQEIEPQCGFEIIE